MKNMGKVFESQFKKSVPDYCLLIRLPDPPQSFTQRSDTRFSVKNPCDFIMFDTKSKTMFALELKTTKYKSMNFDRLDDEKSSSSKMIHRHQILGLLNFSEYENVVAGFLFNFRDEENNIERTYFQDINMFMEMYNNIDKKSFNEIDLILNGAIKIDSIKKRVNYVYDIEKFLDSQL